MNQGSPSVRYRKISDRDSPADGTRSRTKLRTTEIEQITIDPVKPQESTKTPENPETQTIKTEKIEEAVPQQTDERAEVNKPLKNKQERTTTSKTITDTPAKEQALKMNQKTIQDNIACIVKEFSTEGKNNIEGELLKFLDSADIVYHSLTTDAERDIFNKLIKFRLNGEAYSRMSHREIKNYDEFKQTLQNMFLPAYSLGELEKRLLNTRQSYGESIATYGSRLTEALEEYKQGYKAKYNLKKIDDTYNKHLETNAIQTFKRGINNTILKEKIVTNKTDSVKQITEEAMEIEKMMNAAVDDTPILPVQELISQRLYGAELTEATKPQVICNYCNRSNHTWDICKTRMANEMRAQRNPRQTQNQFSLNPQFYPARQPNYQMSNITPNRNFQDTRRESPVHYRQPNFTNYRETNTRPRSQQNARLPAYVEGPQRRPIKHCSFCKTTTGHTFDECRSKFFQRKNYDTTGQPPQKVQTEQNLEDQFNAMRINTIEAQKFTHQGNSTGSSQA